ncbi:MAG: hypothetical protein GF398_13025 [Chitinivibrionales bacterium]|nr:hypothetical protein [Chitinivibrionales bacterium]
MTQASEKRCLNIFYMFSQPRQNTSSKANMLDTIAEKILSNGLKVICLKKNDAPIIAAQIWYKTGSVNERDGIRGISHFIEHMMFRGSSRYKAQEHAQRINDIGGHSNAFTAEDVTAFINAVPRDYLEMALEMEADRMAGLTFNADILETERKVIIEEYHTYMNNPVTKAFLEFRQSLFAGHAYGVSPLGILEDLHTFTRQDCCDYHDAWYAPDNAVAVIVGDFDTEERIFELVDKHFGALSKKTAGEAHERLKVHTPQGLTRMKRRVEFDVPLLILGYPAPESANQDALPLELVQMIASQGESSRLNLELVRKRSLAVMAGGMNHYLRLAGISLFFSIFTPDVSVGKLEKAMLDQIERITDEGITDLEMKKIKNTTLTNRTFELYSAEHLCQRIGFAEVVEGNYHSWVRRLESLQKVSIENLIDVAGKYWDPSHCQVLHLKPKKASPLLYAMGLGRRLFKK